MNWDTTKHQAESIFSSEPLTVLGIKRTKVPFLSGTRDCYSIEVKEDVTYWKEIGVGKTTKKEIVTFQETYKNRNQLSDNRNDAFYYFAYHFRNKNGAGIPFKGYWFNESFTGIAFCLSEEVNEIIRKEKERWDNAKLTKEEDLKIENIGFVDAKLDALEKDINGNNWNPSLNEEEKKLVDDTKTVGEVHTIQRKIALLREQQGKDNKIGNLNDQVDKLKTQLLDIKKKDLNVRLANFRANLSIQESDLQTKFPHNYQQILNESLTLDNLEQLENTIRAVICICATETISQEVNDDNKKANSDEVQILLTHLNLIKNAWSQTVSEISKENNPLYVAIIDQHSRYRQQVEDLIKNLQGQQQPEIPTLDEIITQAGNGKSADEFTASINSLDFYRNSQDEAIKEVYEQRKQEVDELRTLLTFLVEAANVSSDDKNQEDDIFEKRRQVRHNLDDFSEKTSPEAKEAYQVMNKNNQVTNSINKLYGLIEIHLAKYKEKIKDPSKKEFLQMLEERGYVEGTPRFDLYCTIWGIVERYVEDKLDKKVDVYPYVTVPGTNGHTGWKDSENYNKKFNFNVNLDSNNHASLGENFDKAEVMVFATVSHELSHNKTAKEETEGSLKNKKPQFHSDYFWRNFLHRSLFDKAEPTAVYVYSCLSPEKRKKLKDYIFDPSIPNHPDARYLSFPNVDYNAIKVPENERKKNDLVKTREILLMCEKILEPDCLDLLILH